jgi:hypothetical protein
MVRAIALSIALLFGIGVIVPIATEYAEAGPKKVSKHKKKKRSWTGVKKYSKRWWQLYNAQEKRKKKTRSSRRVLRLRQMRIENIREAQIAKGMRDAQNWARAHGLPVSQPVESTYAAVEPSSPAADQPRTVQEKAVNQEVSYKVENYSGAPISSASVSVVGPAVEERYPNRRVSTIGGVATTSLRREIINQMVRENGWVVNDYQKEIGGRSVYVVVAQTQGANGRIQSRLFYFTESDGRIYNVATRSSTNSAEQIAEESEKMIAALQNSPRRLQQASTRE